MMEKLTEHFGDSVFIKGCKTLYANQERKGAPASNAIVRLAAYEDTGLSPEEIKALNAPLNDPLTLDELLEMNGMPVWCVDGIGNQCWGIVSNESDGILRCYNTKTAYWEARFYKMKGNGVCGLHKMGWLAYRRKPEEGTV